MDQIIDVSNNDTIQISAQDIENLLDSFSGGKATVNELKFTNRPSVGDNNKKEENPFSILSESDLNSSYNVSVSLNPKCEVSLDSSGYFSGANVTDVSVESNKSHVLSSQNYANVSPVEANIVSHNGGEIVNWPDLVSQDGYPVCNSCCPYVTCTVCKIRMTSGFCNGLAICQADQVFIKRTFNNKSRFNKCQTMCPVTVLRWCGYCRLKTCIVSKGFKFIENQSSNVAGQSVKSVGSLKRKQTDLMTMYSIKEVPTETTVTEADVSKMQANQAPASSFQETKDIISPYSQPAPLKKRKVSPHISSEDSQAKKQVKQATKPQDQARQMSTDVVSQQPASISSTRSPTPMTNSSRKVESFNIPGRGRVLPPSSSDNSTSQQEHVNSTDILKSDNTLNKSYDGSSFGKTTGKSRGITSNNSNLSATSQWVLDQQERYLKYHMDLFKQRSSQQNYHENYLTSFNICI